MKAKGGAHLTLDDFFLRYDKELTPGEFARKARQAQCPIDLKPLDEKGRIGNT
jgi:hypothetical protein